ncbi:MAG: 4Fe-4S dicluster domain-containing protein [Thiobacillus sp.]|nr:4Fe-4S dicluster domain-containing protein [Thiobacillus sp.]
MEQAPSTGRRTFLHELVVGAVAVAATGPIVLLSSSRSRAAADLPKANGKEYAFVVDVSKCIGCGYCVDACAIENNVPKGSIRTWVERYIATDEGVHVDAIDKAGERPAPPPARVQQDAKWEAFIPKLCNHCENAPCVQVCPVGATFTAPGGFVLVDPEHCIGCGYCIQACPYGVRFFNPETRIADKCTWCYHRVAKGLEPACVTVCPTQARRFGDRNDPADPVGQIYKSDNWQTLKPEMHSDSRVLYLGLPREVI